MDTFSTQMMRSPALMTRGQVVWLIIVQVAGLALAGLALKWAAVPGPAHQMLAAMLAVLLLATALVPAWRRTPACGILAGVALATACWLSQGTTWQISTPESLMLIAYYVPMIAPMMLLAAFVLAIWGWTVRMDCRDASRLGVAALIGGALLAFVGGSFYVLLNHSPLLMGSEGVHLYGVDAYQLAALLAAAATYPTALWLGGVGIRPGRQVIFFPAAMAVLLGAFLVYWHSMPRGGEQ